MPGRDLARAFLCCQAQITTKRCPLYIIVSPGEPAEGTAAGDILVPPLPRRHCSDCLQTRLTPNAHTLRRTAGQSTRCNTCYMLGARYSCAVPCATGLHADSNLVSSATRAVPGARSGACTRVVLSGPLRSSPATFVVSPRECSCHKSLCGALRTVLRSAVENGPHFSLMPRAHVRTSGSRALLTAPRFRAGAQLSSSPH